MATNGITLDSESGISILSFNELRTNLATQFKEIFGSTLNTESSSPDGMLIDIFAYAYIEIAQALQSSISGLNVATAEGVFLDYIGRVMGLDRLDGETDDNYRTRLQNADVTGLATYDGMLSYLQGKIGSGISIIENCEDETDVNGIPAHRVAVYVPSIYSEVSDNDIANHIWKCKPAGIKTFGSSSGTAEDSAGYDHTVYFTRISVSAMTVSVTITEYNEESLPTDYSDKIKSALASWAASEYTPGKDIIIQRMYSPIFGNVEGIESISITVTFGGTTQSSGKIPVPSSECATLAEEDITVEGP